MVLISWRFWGRGAGIRESAEDLRGLVMEGFKVRPEMIALVARIRGRGIVTGLPTEAEG
ncbi:MAG: hypothetical protein HY897_04560 [Deltaproteobacteria bacterium]|nr:hypothetical protein [Deltaproteobacteria bacterium]